MFELCRLSNKNDEDIISERVTGEENMKERFVGVNAGIPDSILEQNRTPKERVNWVKTDVEGAELEVLNGGATDLLSILIEIHGKGDLSSGDKSRRIISYNLNAIFQKEFDCMTLIFQITSLSYH